MNDYIEAEKIVKTATISIIWDIEDVFPLFSDFERRFWWFDWDFELIYPDDAIIEEGTTFKTDAYDIIEGKYLWHVTKYEPEKYLIQFLVSTEYRFCTITIQCKPVGEKLTDVIITFSFLGLGEIGNQLNKRDASDIFDSNLEDWKLKLQYYLYNGSTLDLDDFPSE